MLSLVLALAAPSDLSRWRAQAARVTITRDDWGIAHVKGRSDADAVFGAIYAQAEDDFPRIERNYLTALGRQAEADGEAKLWHDLRARLWNDEPGLRAAFARSPAPMRRLMQAWADGLNFYLATHPQVRPKVLTRFEPWMVLSFTEGSIGGDIESHVSLDGLRALYRAGRSAPAVAAANPLLAEPNGSNGIAIGPAKSASGHALLLINPHTSFFFRSELQMTSDEGLNAYGASTWGQFFIYQGFNARVGWMHTSSTADNVDEFAETVTQGPGGLTYRYGASTRRVEPRWVRIKVRQPDGSLRDDDVLTYRTHHGPITRMEGGRMIATALMHRPVEALRQSWGRTKATDLRSFERIAALSANSSNNTLFASAKGETAFLYPQFMPRRAARFDYGKPVDGSDPATDWQGLMKPANLPRLVSPPGGFLQNTNNWPWSAAGPNSIPRAAYPPAIDVGEENPRGEHALLLLGAKEKLSRDGLLALAFSSYLPAFAQTVPPLIDAFEALPARDRRRGRLGPAIRLLQSWDYRWSAGSTATSLAVFWMRELSPLVPAELRTPGKAPGWIAASPPHAKLAALDRAMTRLTTDFGRWDVPWGEINRFQRLTPDIVPRFDDAASSTPVPFVSGNFGSLAAYGSQPYPNTRRWYGNYGNSFVAVVEFGRRVSARAVTAGGASGDPASPHFRDQAERYASGDFREVYFWPDQLTGHIERVYRPGD